MSLTTLLRQMVRKPRLIIFDLDRTLWPFGIDEFVFEPPYKKDASSGEIYDSKRKPMRPFPEVTTVLRALTLSGIDLGVASRTTYPEGAYKLINLFEWDKLIKHREIYPGSKVAHFTMLKNKTGLEFEDMIFFDDERRNVADTTTLGVTAVLVNDEVGVTMQVLEDGLRMYADKNKKPTKGDQDL